MLPISELRGSIPLAMGAYHWSIGQAFIVSVLGNLIPVILILLFLDPVAKFLGQHFNLAKRFFEWLFARTRRKHSEKIEKWGEFALVIFVGIPLPMTGAWTGALLAFLFGIKFKRAIPLIFLGILMAGVIVTLLSVGVISLV